MAALDFPNSPTTGQTFGNWTYDGTAWVLSSGLPSNGIVAYAQIVASQSGISTATDIAGLSVTWTAVPGRTYRTSWRGAAYASTNDVWALFSMRDAAGNSKLITVPQMLNASFGQAVGMDSVVESGLSGAQTRKMNVSRLSGTGTIVVNAGPDNLNFIMVEDVTMAGNPGGPLPFAPMAASAFIMGSPPLVGALNVQPFQAGTSVNSDPSAVTVNHAAGQFEILKAGTYRLDAAASFGSTANAAHYTQAHLQHNTVSFNETIGSMGAGYLSLSSSIIRNCIPGDTLRVLWGSVAAAPVVRYGGCSVQRVG